MDVYRPLPSYLTIKQSSVEGLGLFAVEPIKKSTNIGISHVADRHFANGYIRTPLGGFGNHSDDPNCRKKRLPFVTDYGEIGDKWMLITNRYIHQGEEITWKYDFYNPTLSTIT